MRIPDSGEQLRTVMTQPGVYFTLEAPFVSVIGLYSNVLQTFPGVIASQRGKPPIRYTQYRFLEAELYG